MNSGTLAIFGYALASIVVPVAAQDVGSNPHHAFVPDSNTAVAIGRAVLLPIYGQKAIQSEEPFSAKRQGDIWIVSGTLHCGRPACVGGTAEVKLSAKDGRILHVTHGR
jgi:NTF2 fold immunity protein